MNSEERLRHFADNLEQYGPDITQWGDRGFVITELRKAATTLTATTEILESLKQTEEALSWLCGALRDQATGHPETLAMWNSTETIRRIEQARTIIKKQTEGKMYPVAGIAGMAWRDIAASAYKAYAASTGNKNYQGLPMPAWKDLTPAIQTAWEAAARQVGECVTVIGDTLPPDEQNWAGWIPPHLKDNDNG